MTDNIVVLLTALDLEYEAVRQRMTGVQRRQHERGTRFEVGTLRGTDCRVALGLTGVGNNASAPLTERAISMFSPTAVVFVGIAGALQDTVRLGDVVVAKCVYAYHGGTSDEDGFKARPRMWETPHRVLQIASHLKRTGDWACEGSAAVHLGPIAAGEVVQSSRSANDARRLRLHYNDAVAIEMEAAGVAQACHFSNSPMAVVRGISDLADGSKTTDHDRSWQPVAAANAAAFATRLAEELINEREQASMSESNDGSHRGTVTNIASGQVGIQAAQVSHSTVYVGAAIAGSPDREHITSQLAQLREELRREHSAGALDTDTHDAAQSDLTAADEALSADTLSGRRASVLSLKRARGLLGDLGELAAKIAPLITAIQGMT